MAGEVADGTAVGGAGQLGAGEREAEADEIVEPPHIHAAGNGAGASSGTQVCRRKATACVPSGAASNPLADVAGGWRRCTGRWDACEALVLQFVSPPAAPPPDVPQMTRVEARARGLWPLA